MKLDKLWVITVPASCDSTIADFCFETDARGFALQVKGGLSPEDIVAVFSDREEAESEAKRLMHRRLALRSRDGFGGRLTELLWAAIVKPDLRDQAKGLLDEILAREK